MHDFTEFLSKNRESKILYFPHWGMLTVTFFASQKIVEHAEWERNCPQFVWKFYNSSNQQKYVIFYSWFRVPLSLKIFRQSTYQILGVRSSIFNFRYHFINFQFWTPDTWPSLSFAGFANYVWIMLFPFYFFFLCKLDWKWVCL